MQTSLPSFYAWRYALFNLVLLGLLGTWLWHQNQSVALADAKIPANAKLQCVSYAPYYQPGQSPYTVGIHIEREQIEKDLALLAPKFSCVRIYSVGEGLDAVPAIAEKLGLKVMLGAWIGWVGDDNEKELNKAIALANQYPNTVTTLVVGNEVLLRGEKSELEMRGYLEHAKESTKVPVTYADVWEFWLKHKHLQDSVDFVTVHILPYWENDPQSVNVAGRHVIKVMDKLSKTFTKPIRIGETGWPTIGRQRGDAIPSQLNQTRYLREFLTEAQARGWTYNLIEAFDQPWKRELEGTVGGYWGLYDTDLTPKFTLTGSVREVSNLWMAFATAIAGGLVFLIWNRQHNKVTGIPEKIGVITLGMLTGLMAYLQFHYLQTACRDTEEWIALSSVVLLGWWALLSLPKLHSDHASVAVDTLNNSLLLLITAAAIGSYLIWSDGRYRDFPLELYALPALQFAFGFKLKGFNVIKKSTLGHITGSIAIVCSAAALYAERPNSHALIWLILTLLLTLSLPFKPKQNVH